MNRYPGGRRQNKLLISSSSPGNRIWIDRLSICYIGDVAMVYNGVSREDLHAECEHNTVAQNNSLNTIAAVKCHACKAKRIKLQ